MRRWRPSGRRTPLWPGRRAQWEPGLVEEEEQAAGLAGVEEQVLGRAAGEREDVVYQPVAGDQGTT